MKNNNDKKWTLNFAGIPCLLINSSFPQRILALLDYVPSEEPEVHCKNVGFDCFTDKSQEVVYRCSKNNGTRK